MLLCMCEFSLFQFLFREFSVLASERSLGFSRFRAIAVFDQHLGSHTIGRI
jgi:hypothetical protein